MLDFNERATNDSAFGFPKLPKDIYTLRIASGKIKRSGKTGGVAVGFELRVEEGVTTGHEQNGQVHFEDCWLGTAEDTEAEDPNTQRGKMRQNFERLKLIVQASGAKVSSRNHGEAYYQDLIDAVVGRHIRGAISIKSEPKKVVDGKEYDAREINKLDAIYSLDEKLPGQRVNGPAGVARVPRPLTIVADEADEAE